jgi:GNAT superfamily N-acetyltransferase
MIERVMLNNKMGTVVYLNAAMLPTDKDKAKAIKVHFDDGTITFATLQPDTVPTPKRWVNPNTPSPYGMSGRLDWDESQHPRGQPANKGQFVTRGGAAMGMTIGKAGEGLYTAQIDGKYAGHAQLASEGHPFVSALHVPEEHSGKGVGHALYDHIEKQTGKSMVPNPLHLTEQHAEIWKKRLSDMGAAEAKRRLTEARTIGYKNFGQKYTTTDKLHMPLREVAGKAQHPGEGYSENAFVDGKGRIHTNNIYDATRALYEKRDVVLAQPREVSTLLDHLQKVSAEFIRLGSKAPVFDLCKVSVEGTNLFCVGSMGIPRVKMPQLDKEMTKKFLHFLQAKGYEVTDEEEFASYLRATQNELNGAKVAGIANAMLTGKFEEGRNPRLVISRDNYILDGHHRWAALVGVDALNNQFGDKLMKVSRVGIGITDLLREAEEFGVPTGEGVEVMSKEEAAQSGGKATGTPKTGAPATKQPDKHGYEFVSPNVKDLKFKDAVASLEGDRHKYITALSEQVDKELGLKGTTKPVLGVWTDGAENSTMTTYTNPTWQQLVASASMKGHLANQKQVLIFNEGDIDAGHGDEGFLASFPVKGDMKEVSDWLGQNGLIYHTLEPTKDGAIVHVYGSDDATMQAVKAAGDHYGTTVQAGVGRGAFLGSFKEGADDEQRADARAVYEREIEGAGLQGASAVWKGLRDRYGWANKAATGSQAVARADARPRNRALQFAVSP